MFVALFAMLGTGVGCQNKIDPASVPPFVLRVEESVTDIVQPLTDDGFIDYLEAANLRHSHGVTPETNWEVIVRTAFGPRPEAAFDESAERQYYQRLGIPPLREKPTDGEYFYSLRLSGEGVTENEERLAGEFHDLKAPWRGESLPELAMWLERQSKHTDSFVAGSQVTRYYAPYVMSEQGHIAKLRSLRRLWGAFETSSDKTERLAAGIASSLFADLDEHPAPLSRIHVTESSGQSRQVARLLSARARLRIGERDLDNAREDILAIHRIGRLLSQGMLEEWILGIALDDMACLLDLELLTFGNLPKEETLQHLKDLDRLPPLRSAADQIDVDDRHVALDAMQYAARRRKEIVQLFNAGQSGIDRQTMKAILSIDWNEAMRVLNDKFDKYVAALEEDDFRKALDAMKGLGSPQRASDDAERLEQMKVAARGSIEELSQFMGQLYFDKYAHILPKIERRPQARREVVRAAYAAHLFRLQEGIYPTSIDELTPILVDPVSDRYTGKPLLLKSIEGGIVIYSVGENLIDDGGQTYTDGSDKDDILIRLTEASSEPVKP